MHCKDETEGGKGIVGVGFARPEPGHNALQLRNSPAGTRAFVASNAVREPLTARVAHPSDFASCPDFFLVFCNQVLAKRVLGL